MNVYGVVNGLGTSSWKRRLERDEEIYEMEN